RSQTGRGVGIRISAAAGNADEVGGRQLQGVRRRTRPASRPQQLLHWQRRQEVRTNLSTYAKVEHRNVYPGVYLVFYGNQGGQLEYDFVVAPHADGNRIAFSIGGLDGRLGVREDANGNLVVPMGEEDVLLHKPRIYQGTSCFPGNSSVDGSMHASCKAIAGGRFVVREPGDFGTQVGFDLPAYDHSQ